jgi:hypothetical protein
LNNQLELKVAPTPILEPENRIITLKLTGMNRSRGGYWAGKKEKLLKRYKTLTEKDLSFNLGSEDEMIETLSYKLGKTRQELLSIIVML